MNLVIEEAFACAAFADNTTGLSGLFVHWGRSGCSDSLGLLEVRPSIEVRKVEVRRSGGILSVARRIVV